MKTYYININNEKKLNINTTFNICCDWFRHRDNQQNTPRCTMRCFCPTTHLDNAVKTERARGNNWQRQAVIVVSGLNLL